MSDRDIISRALVALVRSVAYLTEAFDPHAEPTTHHQSVCEIQARAISERLAIAGRPMRTLNLAVMSVLGPTSVHDRSRGGRLSGMFVAHGNPLCELLDAVPPTPQEAVVWWLMAALNNVRRDAYTIPPYTELNHPSDTMALADRVDGLTARHVPADLAFHVESGISARRESSGSLQAAVSLGSLFEMVAGLVARRDFVVADRAIKILTPDTEPCTGVVAGIRFAALIAGGRRRVFEDLQELAAADFVADSLLNADPAWCTLQLPPVII